MWPDIQLVVIEGRGCNRFLRQWGLRFDHHRMVEASDAREHIACLRNRVFQWFRDQCQMPWLVMMDDDVVPVPETEELLRSPAEVAAARAWGKLGTELHPQGFSMCCVKVHRSVVQQTAPPWFGFGFRPDGTEQTLCECEYFHRKVVAAGFTPQRVGRVGHRFAVTVLPGESGPEFWFDKQVTEWINPSPSVPPPAAKTG